MRYTKFPVFIVLIILLLISCNKNKENDFDIVCDVFAEINNIDEEMSPIKRGRITLEKTRNRLDDTSTARIWWETVISAQKDQRYSIYKRGAEDALEREWECKPMQELAPVTSD